MEQEKTMISNNDFISLMIYTLQMQYSGGIIYFNGQELKEFIFYSKRDPKYSDLLRCFNFTSAQNESFCIELSTAINYAKANKFISVSIGDLNYVSRLQPSGIRMKIDWEYYPLMEWFLLDFNRYRTDPADYIRDLENQMSDFHDIQNGVSDRFCFTLQRKLREQQIEDKDKK